jgi:hypothetical protein
LVIDSWADTDTHLRNREDLCIGIDDGERNWVQN